MNIKITADSTCDLSSELLEKYHISLIPLSVNKGEVSFSDGVDIFPEDIFRYTDENGKLCSTAAPSPGFYADFFSRHLISADSVIHISIGSEFSASYNNAKIAAEQLGNVFVVDSMQLSTGQGLLVLSAAEMAAEGKSADAIFAALLELRTRVESSFILDRLDYMVKGGRCSSVAALGANLLKLKPCIEVVNGRLQVVKKYRGNLQHCLKQYVGDRLTEREDICPDRIFITSAGVDAATVSMVEAEVKTAALFKEYLVTNAGCTISCHCGPGTLGILFIRSK